MVLAAPHRRRLGTGRRRRRERLHGREHPTDEPVRGPAQQPDGAARPGHPEQLVGRALVVRREHHAQARDHRVERGVAVRQRLRVTLLPAHGHADLRGLTSSCLEELRGEVGRDHVGARQGRGDGRIAGPGRDVEHALAAADPGCSDQLGPEVPDQVLGEVGVVAGRPHGSMPGLQSRVGRVGVAGSGQGVGDGVHANQTRGQAIGFPSDPDENARVPDWTLVPLRSVSDRRPGPRAPTTSRHRPRKAGGLGGRRDSSTRKPFAEASRSVG